MGVAANRPSGRLAAGTAVLIVHALLVLLLLRADRGTKADHPPEEVRASILFVLRLPHPLRRERWPAREGARASPRNSRPRAVTRPPAAATTPRVPSRPLPHHPNVDWHETADEVARSLTSRRQRKVHPGSGEYPRSPYRDCKLQPQFAWDPQPKRIGLIDHWLPYLRLGNHCIVSLGFFGCVVGQLPGPNGHLFDHTAEGKPAQNPTPDEPARTWPQGEPRGLCR